MTIEIKELDDPDEKSAVTRKVMHALPAWFSPPEDIEKKAETHRDFPFFVSYDGGEAVGFAALKIHNAFTADIYVIGVLEEYHGRGLGRLLVEAAERYCKKNGCIYLTVKTLDASAAYEPYERTRAFYRAMGFIPLEVFPTLWDKDNPCLFLAKHLSSGASQPV